MIKYLLKFYVFRVLFKKISSEYIAFENEDIELQKKAKFILEENLKKELNIIVFKEKAGLKTGSRVIPMPRRR